MRCPTLTLCITATLASGCGEDRLGQAPPCQISSSERTAYRDLPSSQQLPFDVVLLVDNSPSMVQEIERLESALNDTFAPVLEQSGVDFRVVVISHHGGGDDGVCIEAPLSGTECAPIPSRPANTSRFVHYSMPIGSHDGWCKLLRTFDGGLPDEYALVPGGWRSVLRPEAMKFFIQMSDDGVECRYLESTFDDQDKAEAGRTAARAFDQVLLGTGDGVFGDAGDRLYRWYSIVGFAPQASYSLEPSAPLVTVKAKDAMGPGTGSQALATLTGGLRFSVATADEFTTVFDAIAEHTIDTAVNRVFGCE